MDEATATTDEVKKDNIKQVDVEMDPQIFTMKSVTNEKTEPEQARKQKIKEIFQF